MKNYFLIIVGCFMIFQKAMADQEVLKDQQEDFFQSICTNNIVFSLKVPKGCVAGEAVPLVITIKNQGETNVYFTRGFSLCYDAFIIQLTNAAGKAIPFTNFGKKFPIGGVENYGRRGEFKLTPGKEISLHINLARTFDLTLSGAYVLYIKTAIGEDISKYDPKNIFVFDNFRFAISEPPDPNRKIKENTEYY